MMGMRAVAFGALRYPTAKYIYPIFVDKCKVQNTQRSPPGPPFVLQRPSCRRQHHSSAHSSKPLLGDPPVEELQAGLRLVEWHHMATGVESHVGEVTV
jgi:hypothetical protein